MENIKRQIRLFWVSHGNSIKICILVIIVILLVVHELNELAVKAETEKINKKDEQNVGNIYSREYDDKLINNFLNLCTQGKTTEAYKLLSKNCQENKYPTIDDFHEKYYNKIFLVVKANKEFYKTYNKKLNIDIEYDSLRNIYRVIFKDDILETGNIKNKKTIIHYYKIELEENNKKICIDTEI